MMELIERAFEKSLHTPEWLEYEVNECYNLIMNNSKHPDDIVSLWIENDTTLNKSIGG